MKSKRGRPESLWARHHEQLRDPHEVAVQWADPASVDPSSFDCEVVGPWWDLLDELAITLIVTREYEHIVQAFSVDRGRRRATFLHLPHPNGMAVDPQTNRVFIASTRNPNLVFTFSPCRGAVKGRGSGDDLVGTLLPTHARYFPGCMYLHDLAWIDGRLFGNAVGANTVVRLDGDGLFEPVWWPSCIDSPTGPKWDRNYLQLNSIAAGATVQESFYSASTAQPGRRRPGHLNFPVDRRGVVFDGKTREVCGVGLTRPHSARLRGTELWVDNSGYGELGRILDGRFEPVVKMPGWTRGLYFHGDYAFVGTSRVLPKYSHYAPGLVPSQCRSGVHIVDMSAGRIAASVFWPNGNQLFAIEAVPRTSAVGFPFRIAGGRTHAKRIVRCFGSGMAA